MSTAVLEPGEVRLVEAVASLGDDGPVGACVARLPESQRRVVRLRYWHNWTFEEIAGELGLSRSRVRQLHELALDRLRPMLIDFREAE